MCGSYNELFLKFHLFILVHAACSNVMVVREGSSDIKVPKGTMISILYNVTYPLGFDYQLLVLRSNNSNIQATMETTCTNMNALCIQGVHDLVYFSAGSCQTSNLTVTDFYVLLITGTEAVNESVISCHLRIENTMQPCNDGQATIKVYSTGKYEDNLRLCVSKMHCHLRNHYTSLYVRGHLNLVKDSENS